MLQRLVPLCVLISGCAHVSTEWSELSSMHFVVRTNLPAPAAKGAVVQLEQARTALLPALLGVPVAEPEPLEVVVLDGAAPVAPGALADGLFVRDWRGPVLVLAGDTSLLDARSRLSVLAHELAHHYLGRALRRSPRWLSEGLAAYLETLTLDPDARQATRGKANQDRLADVERWDVLPIDSLWAWDELHDERPGLEQHRAASAWFWVHYLFNERRELLERWFSALAQGLEPRAAWGRVFSEFPAARLAADAAAWKEKGVVRTQRIELSDVEGSISSAPLSPARGHAVLARLAAATGNWERAREELTAGLALAPGEPALLEQAVVAAESAEVRVERARALTTAQPGLAAGWALLGLALTEPGAREAALSRATELEPQRYVAVAELARVQDSVALAERAFELAPDDVRVLTTVAAVFSRAGQCERAQSVQQHAFEVLPHHASQALRTRLEQARARLCH